VPIWKVSADFDEGETVDTVPPRLLLESTFTAVVRWRRPTPFGGLAEEDDGGFGDLCRRLGQGGAEVVRRSARPWEQQSGPRSGPCSLDHRHDVGAVAGAIIGWLINLLAQPGRPKSG